MLELDEKRRAYAKLYGIAYGRLQDEIQREARKCKGEAIPISDTITQYQDLVDKVESEISRLDERYYLL